MTCVNVLFIANTCQYTEEFLDSLQNEKLKDFFIWCNAEKINKPLCFMVSEDINDIIQMYEQDWTNSDFVYDLKLNALFVNCLLHENLMTVLYCYHNKIDLEDCTSSFQYTEDYIRKSGFYKSSVSDKIFISEKIIAPPEISCLSHLFGDKW